MRTRQAKLAIAITISALIPGCAHLPSAQTAPVNQFARFWGVGWSDGYHECDPMYRHGPGLAGRLNCQSCGSMGCNACLGNSCYQVQQFAPTINQLQSPQQSAIPMGAAPTNPIPTNPMPESQMNLEQRKNYSPPPPRDESSSILIPNNSFPMLPEAVPTTPSQSKSDRSLMKTSPEQVEAADVSEPPSPSDRRRSSNRSDSKDESRLPKSGDDESLLTPDIPKPLNKKPSAAPKPEDDDLLGYQRPEPANMIYMTQQPARFVPGTTVAGNVASNGFQGYGFPVDPNRPIYAPTANNGHIIPPGYSLPGQPNYRVVPNPYVPYTADSMNGFNRYR